MKRHLARELTALFDISMQIHGGGLFARLKAFVTRTDLADGDFRVHFDYPPDLLPQRRATGFGLYKLPGIDRHDLAARNVQMRRSFDFFWRTDGNFHFRASSSA